MRLSNTQIKSTSEKLRGAEEIPQIEELSDGQRRKAEVLSNQPLPEEIGAELAQELEEDKLPEEVEIDSAEIAKFNTWLKKFEQAGQPAVEEFFDTDELIKQFLLWGNHGTTQEERQRIEENVKRQSGRLKKDEGLKKKIGKLLSRFYQPTIGAAFPWQTAMSKLLDERVNELQNVDYDSSIREQFYKSALEAKDEFTCQVILLSLAKSSDFRQEVMDQYYEVFGQKTLVADPNNPGKMIAMHMPDTRQRWFENKLRRVANREGRIFNAWKESRTRLVRDEHDKIVVELQSNEKVTVGADYDGSLIGGRRGQLPGECFDYNTYQTEDEAEAANLLLKKRLDKIPGKIDEALDHLAILEVYKKERPEKEQSKLDKKIKLAKSRLQEYRQQKDIIEQALEFKNGYYQQGDLKSMLLDPFSQEKVEIKGKTYYEKYAAADIGFTKYMGAKLPSDTTITLSGEHAIPKDIGAFCHLMTLRRRLEYAWVTNHSLYGARSPTTLEYDKKRDAYRNLADALDEKMDVSRQGAFALSSQGFYIQEGKEKKDGKYYIVARSIDGKRMVRVEEWNSEKKANMVNQGYLDPTVRLAQRQEDFDRLIKEAEARGDYVDKEAGVAQQVLGELSQELLVSAPDDPKVYEDEEQLNISIDTAFIRLAQKVKEIDLKGLLQKNQQGNVMVVQANLEQYMGTLGKEAAVYIDDFEIQMALGHEYKKLFNEFRNNADKYIVASSEEKRKMLPELTYQQLLESDYRGMPRIKEKIQEEQNSIEKAINALNIKLRQACLALVFQRAFRREYDQYLTAVELEGIDWNEVSFAQKTLPEKQALQGWFSNLISDCATMRKAYQAALTEPSILDKTISKDKVEICQRIFGKRKSEISEDTSYGQIIKSLNRFELVYQALLQEVEDEIKQELPAEKKVEEQELAKAA